LTERSASQQHFLDLCEVFNQPKPAKADPSGEWFTFERGAMKHGGDFYFERIRHFNGNLFTDSPVFELTVEEIKHVQAAARLDWSAVDPSVFGTLFERGLDPAKRSQLGAQYTSREDIETLIEPVVIAPLRREWEDVKRAIENLLRTGKQKPTGKEKPLTREAEGRAHREARAVLRAFHERLQQVKVLDPACGSGNFLYVTLQKLKDLEKEVLNYGNDQRLGSFLPAVNWMKRSPPPTAGPRASQMRRYSHAF